MIVPPRIKICGLTRHADARAAADAGAGYGGVILAPGHSRSITAAAAADVFAGLGLRRVGVFVDQDVEEMLEAIGRAGLDVVQLHGDEPSELADRVRNAAPVAIWKAIRVRSAADLRDAVARYAGGPIDALLLDGWSEGARGGTGASFDWAAAAAHRELVPREMELVLAGGLHPGNVARAAALLRPTTVDVSSGVESAPGVKDHALVRAFVAAAQDTEDE